MMLEVLNLLFSYCSFHVQDRVKCTMFEQRSCNRGKITTMRRCHI